MCMPLSDGKLVADGLVVVPRPQQVSPLPHQLIFQLCNLHAEACLRSMILC